MEILIVEDSEDSRVLLEEQLLSLGYRVRPTINGVDALSQIESNIPDLIISDILMPEMDGFELCRQLKREPRYQSIPFIFYSATYTDNKDIELALSLGADRFIIKPEPVDVIEKTIQEVLAVHKKQNIIKPTISDSDIDSLYEKRLKSKLDKKVAELESQRKQLHAITDALPVLIAEVDQELKYKYVNHAYKTWYQLPYEQILNKCMDEIELEQSYSIIKPYIESAVDGGDITFEEDLVFPDGVNRSIHGRYIAKERGGDGFFILLTDVTSLKKNEREREILQKQLTHAQKMQSIGHLSGGLAHDFNNILGITIAQLELIKRRIKDNPDLSERIEQAISNTWRGADLVEKLMDFARKESIGRQDVDVNESITLFKTLIEKSITSAIHLKLNLQPDLSPVEVDPGELESALLNLAINASHAMPTGGVLTIETQSVQTDKFRIAESPSAATSFVLLTISDNGSGMSESVKEHLFEPFFTTKAKGKGTGLGLSMVFGFVQRSEGFIEVESEEGQGSRFLIYIPAVLKGNKG
ncbi:MAG: response regulator [Gammaproteobacteria bacterium]|nr:response regulator [Gammaproteobacteria bacterium]